MLLFARAQAASHRSSRRSSDNEDDDVPSSDRELLQAVLDRPNVISVDAILGGEDRVIAGSRIRKFLADFPSVQVVEMPGLAHDPFEEDPEAFVETVQRLLRAKQ